MFGSFFCNLKGISKSDRPSRPSEFSAWLAEVTNLAKTPDPFAGGFGGYLGAARSLMTSQAHLQLWEERLFGKAVSWTNWYGMKR